MPAVKLLITYNVKPAREEAYYRFMAGEFLPTVQKIGLIMVEAWRTAWGDYPERLIGLVAEDHQAIAQILAGEPWREIEAELEQYVEDYQRKLVPYRSGFQFLKPS
jgi:hypothetical protein